VLTVVLFKRADIGIEKAGDLSAPKDTMWSCAPVYRRHWIRTWVVSQVLAPEIA
jgi:hypothetical protein